MNGQYTVIFGGHFYPVEELKFNIDIKQTDGCYQVHYLPRFAVDKHGHSLPHYRECTMNRLAVGWSARAQQANKVNNRINRLMPLHKTDTEFYSGQDRHTDTDGSES